MFLKPAIILLAVALLSAFLARARVRSITARGLTSTASSETPGSTIARHILDEGGAAGVDIREYGGMLADHFDPKKNVLFLHSRTLNGSTATAHGTAAYLAGKALQHRHEPGHYRHRRAAVRLSLAGAGLFALVLLFLAVIQRIPGSLAIIATAFAWAAAQVYNLLTVSIDFTSTRRPQESLATLEGLPKRGKHYDLTVKVLKTLALEDLGALLRTFPHLVYNTLPFLSRKDK